MDKLDAEVQYRIAKWVLSATDKPVTLYHKHTADTQYYHKHWETWNVAKAVEGIKGHDTYVIEKKGSGRHGRI